MREKADLLMTQEMALLISEEQGKKTLKQVEPLW